MRCEVVDILIPELISFSTNTITARQNSRQTNDRQPLSPGRMRQSGGTMRPDRESLGRQARFGAGRTTLLLTPSPSLQQDRAITQLSAGIRDLPRLTAILHNERVRPPLFTEYLPLNRNIGLTNPPFFLTPRSALF